MSRPTEHYIRIPQWVFQALADGQITADQFDLLVFCYGKCDWDTNSVRSYSAESLCRFRRLDATEANLKRYRRAKLDLKKRRIIWDDYEKGVETPYTLYLPAVDPFEYPQDVESLSARAMSVLCVPPNVRGDDEASDATSDSCEPAVENLSVPVSAQNDGVLSIKDHTAVKTTQAVEREPLNPLSGDFSPSAPSRGNAQPAGANDKPPQKKTLNSQQCDELNSVVDAFTTAWAQFHRGFSCDQSDLKKLLRECSPLEVLIAYRGMAVDQSNGGFKDFPSSRQAAFFDRGAKAAIRTNRQNQVQFCLAYGPDAYLDFEVPEFYELDEKWCAIFERPLPFVYWTDNKDIPHFYHPRLHEVLDPWKAALDAAAQRVEAARKAEEKAAAEKKRKEEIALEQAGLDWMRDARAHVNDDDQGIQWMVLNLPKEEWAIRDHFFVELKRLRKVEQDRREFEALKNSGALDPAIRFLEEELLTGSGYVSLTIAYGVKKGLSEDHIRKAAQVMKLTLGKLVGEPCWEKLPPNYNSPISDKREVATGKN